MENLNAKKNSVKDYYGKVLQSSADLKTDACCTMDSMPRYAKAILSQVSDEVMAKYYGCGIVMPEDLGGCKILDLGSGSGRDCYVLSKLVGETGKVIGVDMTDEQLAVANSHVQEMAFRFGFKTPNVEFLKGDIEKLDELGLTENSFDCIVSNCVVNLAEDKLAVLKQAHRLLKEGGEFYFSDIYSDRRIGEELTQDPELYGECLSGALYWNDFENMAKQSGFVDPRIVATRPLMIENQDIKDKVGNTQFVSTTYRLFKVSHLEPDCEDYGQAICYKGSVPFHPQSFGLDSGHIFQTGKIYPVCGNSYLMLKKSRFSEHFDFWGDFSTHYGIFPGCGGKVPQGFQAEGADHSSAFEGGGSCC